ncbi:MAG: chloride channel protein [Planctomycetota bacterium]|nr:chloride channel protein [Planctomycetota bacterium]
MTDHQHPVQQASTTGALPVSPSLGPALQAAQVPGQTTLVDSRVLYISLLSVCLGAVAAGIAKCLMWLIAIVTGIAFFGHATLELKSPANNHLGWWVVLIPVIGGIIVGFMARYGSTGIRGHGIPEAMEQVLLNESRIPARLTFLKPLSAAVAIGTGGPFGAEGPIIATGGALGSLIGQVLRVTAAERKTLLAAGAAAGMSATFAAPVSAVLLAIELLLFEYRPRSFLPVALASTVAAGVRFALHLQYPVFDLPALQQPSLAALAIYMALGLLVGIAAVYVTRAVYWVEDMFEHTHIHWMWWPALGAVAVGLIGHFQPRTLGVGYDNISDVLSNRISLWVVVTLCGWKFISWAIALGSGTSGGTLAPLFTVGAGLGYALGVAASHVFRGAGVALPIAALVGMAAMFAGASRALLASVVFAFETTLQPIGLLPLLAGCTAAYFVSCLMMRNTIMTEKIARRGVRVPVEYESDLFAQIAVRDAASTNPITVSSDETVENLRNKITSGQQDWTHQGFPVVDARGLLLGLVTRRDIQNPVIAGSQTIGEFITRLPILVYDDLSLREAADHMVNHNVGRLPVVERRNPGKVIGIITRGDILAAQRSRVNKIKRANRSV